MRVRETECESGEIDCVCVRDRVCVREIECESVCVNAVSDTMLAS